MEQPVEQPYFCQVVWKEKRTRFVNILIIYIWILVIFQGHNIVNELNCTICSEKSNLFDSWHEGTLNLNEWTCVAVLYVAMEKVHVGLAVICTYHQKLSMLFDLAFQMKCKYFIINTYLIFEWTINITSSPFGLYATLNKKSLKGF